MRPILSFLLVSIAATGLASSHRHRPALQGEIGNPANAQPTSPMPPLMGQVLPSSSGSGSLVAHGNFLYALMGDRVYKLDPRDLHVLSVQRLGAPTPASTTRKKPRRHRVIEE